MNLSELDLNLLVVLDALFDEGSVGRAATRLKRSQPAVSNALARLRLILKDPLFVRGKGGMVPTERAQALRGPLGQALRQLEHAFESPRGFDPKVARRTFTLAASDHAQLVVLPALAQVLAAHPGLELKVVAPPRDFPIRELESGELDLVLGAFDLAPGDSVPRGLKRQALLDEKYVVVARKGHPVFSEPLARSLGRPQLHVSPRGGTSGPVDRKLKLQRNIVLFVPHYLAVPWVLAGSDLLAAVPERLAKAFAPPFGLQVAPVDLPGNALRLHQVWHPVRHADAAHRWLRGQVLAAAKSARA